ncbi:lasso peptide biosynthesis B2 protein [Pseudomonas sp. Irchel s3f10]|uniref:lasso peptide biosynthesis B2 protein n=1 Tax=Pseudomonas sp. Irchel s3f10 TaxID=2009137 RepID=UPI000BA3A9CB|nr:lasso peptide biosynthesis B2 protein [Pseudomonas sp. Irchel s3f10]
MEFTFQPHAHAILLDNQLVILDEKLDTYLIFNESQTTILIKGDKDCNEYNEIRHELSSLNIITDSIHNSNPLTKANDDYEGIDNYTWRIKRQNPRQSVKLLPTMRACLDLLILKVTIALGGLETCLNSMRASKKALSGNPVSAWHESIESYAQGVRIASLVLPFKVKCLESSICLFKHAMRNNKKCDFFIGVQLYDFLSHAWIEINGEVIADDPHLSRKLPKILTI